MRTASAHSALNAAAAAAAVCDNASQTLMLKAQGRRETDGAKWWEGN
jgi:hypothetical protein